MKKHNSLIIVLFIFLALPTPFSLISWIGTIISVANIGMTNWSDFRELIQGVAALITMLLAGTYLVTYIISLSTTLKNNVISLISFLPLLHIILLGISAVIWSQLNTVFQ